MSRRKSLWGGKEKRKISRDRVDKKELEEKDLEVGTSRRGRKEVNYLFEGEKGLHRGKTERFAVLLASQNARGGTSNFAKGHEDQGRSNRSS